MNRQLLADSGMSLPDYDVFTLDANANPPVATGNLAHVGTVIFNMVANPASGCRACVRTRYQSNDAGIAASASCASCFVANAANTHEPEPLMRAFGMLRNAEATGGNLVAVIRARSL